MLEEAQETAAGDEGEAAAPEPAPEPVSEFPPVVATEPVLVTVPAPVAVAFSGPEPEPEDEVPPEYRHLAPGYEPEGALEGALEPWEPSGAGIAVRVVAYSTAVAWPFLGTAYEYFTLNASRTYSYVCGDDGCSSLPAGTEFLHRALPWLVPVSAASTLLVMGVRKLARRIRESRPAREFAYEYEYEYEDARPPVPKVVLAGAFAGVCALAFVVGVLRGVMINVLGY